MNERAESWLPVATLIALAALSGVAWRSELEWTSGWHGLVWLGYFHWAVPLAVAGFVAWAACFAPVRRRLLFTTTLAIYAVLGYFVAADALWFFFISGPSASIIAGSVGGGDFDLGVRILEFTRWAAVLAWPLVALGFCLICRAFGAPITFGCALLSGVFFTVSWPLAIFVRSFLESRGSADLIHALKSGFVVPFLVLSLGFPLLRLPAVLFRASPRTNAV